MDDNLLAIYLNDHLAGATGARELVKRARDSSDGELATFLERLRGQIDVDRDTLLAVMDCVGAGQDHLKVIGGMLAERLGRLKLNGRLLSRSPLSDLVELEALAVGIEGKRGLWMMLGELRDPRLDREFDFAALARRAQRQRRQLERWRREVGRAAFT